MFAKYLVNERSDISVEEETKDAVKVLWYAWAGINAGKWRMVEAASCGQSRTQSRPRHTVYFKLNQLQNSSLYKLGMQKGDSVFAKVGEGLGTVLQDVCGHDTGLWILKWLGRGLINYGSNIHLQA